MTSVFVVSPPLIPNLRLDFSHQLSYLIPDLEEKENISSSIRVPLITEPVNVDSVIIVVVLYLLDTWA